jgi:hypothetical protein
LLDEYSTTLSTPLSPVRRWGWWWSRCCCWMSTQPPAAPHSRPEIRTCLQECHISPSHGEIISREISRDQSHKCLCLAVCSRSPWFAKLEYRRPFSYVLYNPCATGLKHAPHCNENPIYVFPENELHGLSPNFHIHLSVSDLYSPRISTYIFLQQNWQTDRSQTHECENWGLRPRNSVSGNICFEFSVESLYVITSMVVVLYMYYYCSMVPMKDATRRGW